MPKRALIVIDVQNEYFDGALPISDPPTATSLANIGRAMDAATRRRRARDRRPARRQRPRGAHLQPRARHAWELHPDIEPRGRTTTSSDKSCPARSRARRSATSWPDAGVDTVAITGYMTHMCVDTTAPQAAHRGLAVEILNDATGTLPLENSGGTARARSSTAPRSSRRASSSPR